ncbi:spore germination protein [Robertmurraya kyonggiensis]|uniref:Spore germination protein n=1 Tax=Robertmurraya kyonggiensis TaxID=1037680 RepID=A0A4U1CXZ2_9BACI|nr:spore germination protein [Robertmurraya kyonggiensis]TKC14935.1 spore germination protein [Robertmurraya kyonggiensis]
MRLNELKKNDDFIKREVKYGERKITLYYLKSICDEEKITDTIISPFYEIFKMDTFVDYIQSFEEWAIIDKEKVAIDKIFGGNVVISLEDKIYAVKMDKFESRSISESSEESVLQGPKDSLSEKISTSLNIIRNRYRKDTLIVKNHKLGQNSKTNLIVLYDNTLCDHENLLYLNNKLKNIEVDLLQSAGQLQKFLMDRKWCPFPLFLTTERPDRVVTNLSQGKIVFLIEGSSWALIGPARFYDFFKSMDDPVELPIVGKFFILIRYIAVIITLFFPALYVAVISYTPEILKIQFALLIAGSRISVPFPSYAEIIFMMIMAEFLSEASIRLPRTISSSATTVGGLILGQAASEAGLIGDVMIVVIATVALSIFVIPINSMHQAIRVLRYPFIILGSLFGAIGVLIGAFALLTYLCNLRSLGKPYMQLLTNKTL